MLRGIIEWSLQALYNPQVQQAQYYNQLYGTSSSSTMNAPYYYGYSLQPQPPRGPPFSTPPQQRMAAGPSYVYYPTQMDTSNSSFSGYPTQQPLQPRHPFSSPTGIVLIILNILLSFFFSYLLFSGTQQ